MGFQTMGSQSNGQQSHLQQSQLARQNSWYSLTLNEVNSQLGDMGKPLGSMNLDELLQNVWAAEANKPVGNIENEHISSSSSLQRQASLTLAQAFSRKTVDDVWREIQQGQRKRYGDYDAQTQDREMTLGETTLEDFLVQAGLFAEASVSPNAGLNRMDSSTAQSLQQKTGLSPSPSVSSLSDTKPGRKRDAPDAYEKALERRLRRKIKNRESAARSRARKQQYHNELVSKVSQLEEENIKLKKEKEFEERLSSETSPEPKYQLRRISSAFF